MTPKSESFNGVSSAALAETTNGSNPERERVFSAYRQWGYLEGDLDPLGFLRPREAPELEHDGAYAREARAIYSSTIGVEINHIYAPERRRWIYERMESEPPEEDQQRILDLLTRADIFEQVMQQRYLGSKRFSLEGVTALIPLVDEVLESACRLGAIELVMGMSHRGRLNVIAHVAQRPAEEIFAGFEDVDPRSVLGSGDVKYHMGATGEYTTRSGGKVHIHLVSNPSHLEAVDPVTVGRTRAKQDRTPEGGREKYLPLLVHGDAAFAGQGILAETMNYADLPGYTVGGTIHVVANNLLGFTTSYVEEHSTRFAACIARRQSIPIFHVNGEDVDAVVRVARIATEYRYKFGTDVVIDLIGYRRHGHSEVDDPTITQPLLYKKIKEHPPLWEIYADDIGASDAQARAEAIKAEFEAAQKKAGSIRHKPTLRDLPKYWAKYFGGLHRPEYEVETGLSSDELSELTSRLTTYPDGFHIHPKVKKLLEQRAEMGSGKRAVDYGMAEALAFASLVKTGIHVRFSGQDSRRGTFNQRHSVLVDIENENEYVPLENIVPQSGPLRDLQLDALRSGRPRLRIRLQPRLPRIAGPVGSPVRRLRQRCASHHRPVHQRRRSQVESALRPGHAAASRLRRPGTGTFQRPHRALHPTRRQTQHPDRAALQRRAVFPSPAPPGPAPLAQAAGRLHAEEHAAPSRREFAHRRLHPQEFSERHPRHRSRRSRPHPDLHREDRPRTPGRTEEEKRHHHRDRVSWNSSTRSPSRRSSPNSTATARTPTSSGCRKSPPTWARCSTCSPA